MSGEPAPLTPEDCDLRGYEFMPVFGVRMFRSKWYSAALKNPRAGLAAMKLWWEAWLQVPAGSLPDDDEDLARFADFGPDLKGWMRVRDVALHGFIRCSDGRLYHPVVSSEAIKAYERRLVSDKKRELDRERLRRWREARSAHNDGNSSDPKSGPSGQEPRERPAGAATEQKYSASATRHETRFETPHETRFETPMSRMTMTMTETETRKNPPYPPRGAVREPDLFEQFWRAYPRKVGKGNARTAWTKAIRTTPPEQIVAAVIAYPWTGSEKFTPHPSTWLNGERWLDEAPNRDEAILRAAGVGIDEPPPAYNGTNVLRLVR